MYKTRHDLTRQDPSLINVSKIMHTKKRDIELMTIMLNKFLIKIAILTTIMTDKTDNGLFNDTAKS